MQSFNKSPSESYPSPSSKSTDGDNSERRVVLERFSEEFDGKYHCQIKAGNGDTLLDTVVRSETDSQTLDVVRLALGPPRRRHQTNHIMSTFTISTTQNVIGGADLASTEQYPFVDTLHLCARIIVPSANDLSGSIGIGREDDIFRVCAPELLSPVAEPWSPRDFYNSVHVPEIGKETHKLPAIEKLQCKLYPFQKRAVQWLLRREGVGTSDEPNAESTHGFVETTDADGVRCFVSPFLGLITSDEHLPSRLGAETKGGILAEEMGLGKTVEMIALMCLHKRDPSQRIVSPEGMQQSSATLIITPPSILQQWRNELQTLAPSLKTLVYEGLRVEAGVSNHTELLSKCMDNDVILTTYNVLAKEIHYAETPDRSLRHEKKYEKRLSPLTQTVWWRILMDEVSMIESGVSNAAKVAKLIPRQLAWCVSGTPVRKDARDLFGLLDFLRYKPYCDLPLQAWDSLVKRHRSVFKQIFGALALRHTKEFIKDDIQLPPQKRVVITVPFTPIEEQHYSTLFKQMSDECGLDVDGSPILEDWDPESTVVIERMRSWLNRLRQTCLHPEVGAKNRKALGSGRGPLRTVAEVLEVMIDQNETATRSEERTLLLSQLRRGQILEHAESSEEALQIWLQTLEQAKIMVQDCRDHLRVEIDRLGLSEDLLSIGEIDAEGAPTTRTGTHRQRLRGAIEIEHSATFFIANAYYQIKTDEKRTNPQSDEYSELERKEESTYERAKSLRKELLQEARKKADSRIEKIKQQAAIVVREMPPSEAQAGIESRTYIDRTNDLIDVMRRQAKQLEEWRGKTQKLLLTPLVDEEQTDLQGDEYETSTKQQDEVYVYVDALRALIADRHDVLTGQKNELIKHEMGVALKQAKDGQGHSPELLIKLLTIRDDLLPKMGSGPGSVRGLITDIRDFKTTLRGAVERGNSRAAAELLIVNGALEKLHRMSIEQTKTVTGLEREVELFKDTMNLRLEYYRQLQQISDTVAPYEEELDEEARKAALTDKRAAESRSEARIATLKSKGRYLVHLRDEATNVESQRCCIICQQPFEIGLLTSCGHSYCAECFRLWWNTHRNCPICKKHLHRNDFHQITYKPQELTMEEEEESSTSKEKAKDVTKDREETLIYSNIRENVLNQIKSIDLDGSFGTKIDTLARHILWIREHDPGAKSIVFSQYKDFLDVLARAFGQFKIGFTSIDRKDGIQKFQNDPSKECFFLHAKAHSSGLNLVNATHVFLCEPLINTAIELQAIARVHRIGQHRPTTVWIYIVENSVEKSIYDISVTRRLAHMAGTAPKKATKDQRNLENKIEAANTLELEQTPLASLLTKGSAGGEMVAKDDLWNCLFQQRPGQPGRVSDDAEREVARHLGATAAESRREMNDVNTA